jgi:23S rRNA (cytosine1962-C5)-methyltransferase
VVAVVDPQKNSVGQAFWAETSPIALRLVSRKAPADEGLDDGFFRQAISRALARRRSLAQRDAFRLVHGEADGLPGLFVDRYGPALSIQSLSEGAEVRKELFARMLLEETSATHAVFRDDASGRDFEGLPREKRAFAGKEPFVFTFHEGPAAFSVDLMGDMKTGSFLDQVDNHLRAGELAWGNGLDCFSYHGGFALAMARGCEQVLAIEQEEGAAAKAVENVKANGLSERVTVQCANVFDVLRGFEREGRKFETVVLDPPGLAKRKQGMPAALRAYRELNLRAFKILSPDGLLVTCSCSGKVDRETFESTVMSAAHDAKRSVQILERRGAGIDHPVLAGLPQSEYLKSLVLRAV